ncbi:CIS tube protein [Pseudobutyrivibrio sp. MD2005]|uniref:CIS tube protein n=1 Tax=Pseudobutyrivibrio sp. MD2005 TaxID=1410616 RepID=UPI0004836DFE|nr:hypothetical protein [Pseudobutyrivibrio sp. MD2005]
MGNAFTDLAGNALGSAVGNIEHGYLVVFDTGMVNPIKKEEAERLEANRPMVPINLAGLVDLTKLAEQLAAVTVYAQELAALMSALFPGLTIDEVKNKAKGVQVKKLKVQFNPSQVQINAIGSKLAYIQDTTAEKNKEGKTESAGYQQVPPRISVSIPIIIDEEDNTSAFASDSANILNASNVAQNLLNWGSGSKCQVKEETEAILSLLRNSFTRTVGFFWGSKMSYVGSLISAQATYTMFHRNGDPCRARINLQILTVERSISAGFRNQWINKYNKFRDMDRTVLSQWGENANAGNFFNLPF